MRGEKWDDVCMGSSREDTCFALRVVGWMGLRRDGDLDCYFSQLIGVDGGEEASSVVGAVGKGSNHLACLL